jgi:hypothetical protein
MTMIMPPVKRYGASSVAALHISGISTGFISSLGQEFVTALYEAIAESIADGMRKFLKMSPQELDAIGEKGEFFISRSYVWRLEQKN